MPLFQNNSLEVQNHSCENDFEMHENELAGTTLFHMNGFNNAHFDTEA